MRKLIVPSACLALLATTALAQTPPPPPAVGVAAQAAWGQQADIQGTVKAFKMTPVGDLEGMKRLPAVVQCVTIVGGYPLLEARAHRAR